MAFLLPHRSLFCTFASNVRASFFVLPKTTSSAAMFIGSLSSRHRDLTQAGPQPLLRTNKRLPIVSTAVQVGGITILREEVVKEDDPANNVPDSIFSKIGLQLHRREDHPLGILKSQIYNYFDERFPRLYQKFDDLSPIVSVKANFDDVLVPSDHVSRRYNDTYYINSETVLRCHTSAHQAQMLHDGHTHFLVTGDVYRRDSIDATHYPVFHQMEGFRIFNPDEWEGAGVDGTTFVLNDLKETLEGLANWLFGNVQTRWMDTYFPFTDPSLELEIFFQGKWLEVLGCGVTQPAILENNGRMGTQAWAFGLGLERLAMILFDIPDIRLFWSKDPRFISQVTLIDSFTKKKGMTSNCFRITYRSMERSLTDEEINQVQNQVRDAVVQKLKVTIR